MYFVVDLLFNYSPFKRTVLDKPKLRNLNAIEMNIELCVSSAELKRFVLIFNLHLIYFHSLSLSLQPLDHLMADVFFI